MLIKEVRVLVTLVQFDIDKNVRGEIPNFAIFLPASMPYRDSGVPFVVTGGEFPLHFCLWIVLKP